MSSRSLPALIVASVVCFAAASPAQTPLNGRVLVVYNAEERDSKQIAEYYLTKRSIPQKNLCKIDFSAPEVIKKAEYDSSVKHGIQTCLNRVGKGTILYIVLSYQTPFMIDMGSQTNALDQFIADIWDEYLPERTASQSDVQPYFGAAESEGDVYQPFLSLADYRTRPNARTIYSVWRLDGPNAAVATGLVDKALEAEAKGLAGIGCFDRNRGDMKDVADYSYGGGNWDIQRAADFTRRAGFQVIEDEHGEEFGTAPAPLRCDHAALYTGWYNLDHYNDAFSWNPGAIGLHLDSASARNPRSGNNWAANALAHGITVTAGAITEPYLDNLPHPDQAFFYLFNGANVGDALLRSERMLKWNIINIGDPLYRPFADSATLAARVRPPLMLALMPQQVLGDSESAGVIALGGPASQDVKFYLTSDNSGLVTVPASVIVQGGRDGVKFPINTHHVAGDATTVQIRAKANGYEIANTLVLFSLLGSLSISPENVKPGSEATGTIVLRRPAVTNTEVTLKSSNPGVVKLPAELTISQGQDKTSFPIATQPVKATTSVEISAAYEGVVRSATLKIAP